MYYCKDLKVCETPPGKVKKAQENPFNKSSFLNISHLDFTLCFDV